VALSWETHGISGTVSAKELVGRRSSEERPRSDASCVQEEGEIIPAAVLPCGGAVRMRATTEEKEPTIRGIESISLEGGKVVSETLQGGNYLIGEEDSKKKNVVGKEKENFHGGNP